jgi:hypothetical protein
VQRWAGGAPGRRQSRDVRCKSGANRVQIGCKSGARQLQGRCKAGVNPRAFGCKSGAAIAAPIPKGGAGRARRSEEASRGEAEYSMRRQGHYLGFEGPPPTPATRSHAAALSRRFPANGRTPPMDQLPPVRARKRTPGRRPQSRRPAGQAVGALHSWSRGHTYPGRCTRSRRAGLDSASGLPDTVRLLRSASDSRPPAGGTGPGAVVPALATVVRDIQTREYVGRRGRH